MTDILQYEHPTLRKKAQAIPLDEITSPRITEIIQRMKKALRLQADGVAIAAPQIGEAVRIFVVSGHAIALSKNENPEEEKYQDLICINPRITKQSKKKEWMDEGCLSVRWLYGSVERSTQTTIEAYDEHGVFFSRGGSGLLSQIFQHETDHLDGVLFIDKARDVEELLPEDSQK